MDRCKEQTFIYVCTVLMVLFVLICFFLLLVSVNQTLHIHEYTAFTGLYIQVYIKQFDIEQNNKLSLTLKMQL